jgi:polyisoprenoid-binding protein YceI
MQHIQATALTCGLLVYLPPAGLAAASFDGAGLVYRLDPCQGPVEWVLTQAGVLTTPGQLTRFGGEVVIDPRDPLSVRLDLALDATSVASDGARRLAGGSHGRAWDTAAHPIMRLRSSGVAAAVAGGYVLRCLLEIAGASRPLTFDLALPPPRQDAITGTEVAEMVLTGRFSQAALGIALDTLFAAPVVELRLVAAVELSD